MKLLFPVLTGEQHEGSGYAERQFGTDVRIGSEVAYRWQKYMVDPYYSDDTAFPFLYMASIRHAIQDISLSHLTKGTQR